MKILCTLLLAFIFVIPRGWAQQAAESVAPLPSDSRGISTRTTGATTKVSAKAWIGRTISNHHTSGLASTRQSGTRCAAAIDLGRTSPIAIMSSNAPTPNPTCPSVLNQALSTVAAST